MPGTEVLLMALVTGLYLYDSALLLHANEAVLVARGRGTRWLAGFGSTGVTFRGKEFWLPNPLLPARPVFRLVWKQEDATGALGSGAAATSSPAKAARAATAMQARWTDRAAPLMRLRWPLCSLALTMFVLLPASLAMGPSGDWYLLAAFVLIYAQVLAILAMLFFSRRALELSGKGVALIALDLLLCPPFALNLMRRLSLRVQVREDFVDAARRLLTADDWQAVQQALLARMDEEILNEGDDSPRLAALASRRENIAQGRLESKAAS